MYWILMNLVFGLFWEGLMSFITVFLYKQIMIQNFSFCDIYVLYEFSITLELFW